MYRINPFPSHKMPYGPSLSWLTVIYGRSGPGGVGYRSDWWCEEPNSIADAVGYVICARTGGKVPLHAQVNSVEGIVWRGAYKEQPPEEGEEWL